MLNAKSNLYALEGCAIIITSCKLICEMKFQLIASFLSACLFLILSLHNYEVLIITV